MVRAGHPLVGRGELAIAELGHYPLLLSKAGDRARVFAEERFAAAGVACAARVEFDSILFAREMLLLTDMLTFLPIDTLRPDVDADRIAVLSVPELEWTRPVGILYGKRNPASAAALTLIAELQDLALHLPP
jgi:DNA-binding transcriptional LysR family regulator